MSLTLSGRLTPTDKLLQYRVLRKENLSTAERSKRSRQVNKLLASSAQTGTSIEYNFDAADWEHTGILHDDQELIQDLQQKATLPTTTDILSAVISKLRMLGTLEQVQHLHSLLLEPPAFDIYKVDHVDQLKIALQRPFTLLFAPQSSSVGSTHAWSIKDQIESLYQDGVGSAYQPGRRNVTGETATGRADVPQMRRLFLKEGDITQDDLGTNFLDLVNRSGHSFVPDAIKRIDLIRQIKQRMHKGGFSRSNGTPSESTGFMLLSRPSVSGWHTDKAGYCTVLTCLEGKKFWFTPRGDWGANLMRHYYNGSARESSFSEFTAQAIEVGDTLIQCPGTPHAVVTPCDTLFGGDFVLIPSLYHRSIRVMRLTLEGRLESNEELDVIDYQNHALILDNICDFEDIMETIDHEATWAEVGELLESQSLLTRDNDFGFRRCRQPRRVVVPKKGDKRKAELQNARVLFLLACDNFWWGLRHQRIRPQEGELVWSEESSGQAPQSRAPGIFVQKRSRRKRAVSSVGGSPTRGT